MYKFYENFIAHDNDAQAVLFFFTYSSPPWQWKENEILKVLPM